MSSLDFSPSPGAAPVTRRVVSHALTETGLLLRNGEQLLLALVIPIAILAGGQLAPGRLWELTTLAPSVLTLAVWSTAFTSVAISTGFERRYGVLERLASTPLTRRGLLAGKAGSVILVIFLQLAVLTTVAVAAGWRPAFDGLSLLLSTAGMLLGIATFCCFALLLAGTLRAEATLALANLLHLVLLAGGALVLPVAAYPEAVQPVIGLLPTAAMGELLRQGSVGQALWWPLPLLAGWLLLGATLASHSFRWTA